MTQKAILIRISVLVVMITILVNLPQLLGSQLHMGVMIAIGSWQIGTWCSELANYLVEKYCG